MVKILINNQQKIIKINIKNLKRIIKIILKSVGEQKATVGITLVDDKKIQKLNKKFRNKNKPTDVLSFYLREKDIPPH